MGNEEGGGDGFFACYLLCSLSPRHKGHTYIGFTVNPRRRIRQHNGEIRCGASRTKKKRPWEMILCIYGFPSNVLALQFEWAWQHPRESLAVRKAAATFKSLSGIANKIKLVYTMLALPSWHSLNLTVNFFSTKYMKFTAGCPTLPQHMHVQVCSMDELPCYMGSQILDNEEGFDEDEDCIDDERETKTRDISAIESVRDDTGKEAAHILFPLQMDFQLCPMDKPACSMGSQVLDNDDDDLYEDEDCNSGKGHGMKVKDLSSIKSGSHELEKAAALDINPLIENSNFRESSTRRVQSFIEFTSYRSNDTFGWNEEANLGRPTQQLSPRVDDNPPSLSMLSPKVTVRSIHPGDDFSLSVINLLSPEGYGIEVKNLSSIESGSHEMEKAAAQDLNPLIEDSNFKEPSSTPRVQSFIDFTSYRSKDIFGLNKEVNLGRPAQQLSPHADDYNPPSMSIPSPKVTTVKSFHPADDFSLSVINLLSPEGMQTPFSYRIRSCHKRSSTFPETIDLTDSPTFIQLDE